MPTSVPKRFFISLAVGHGSIHQSVANEATKLLKFGEDMQSDQLHVLAL